MNGSDLAGTKLDSINFTVSVNPQGFFGDLLNSATFNAATPYGNLTMKSFDPLTGNTTPAPTKFTIPRTDIFIPNALSPNNDGKNDKFFIKHPYDVNINLQVYNRWGNLVYNKKDYTNDWDGKSNQPGILFGTTLPDGTYFYLVEVLDKATGKTQVFRGYLTLKR